MTQPRRALVIGGSIGGLFAANALRDRVPAPNQRTSSGASASFGTTCNTTTTG